MKLIVDTNIIISAALNLDSQIGQIIFKSKSVFSLHAPEYALIELHRHRLKILKVSGYSEFQYIQIVEKITSRITFHKHLSIPIFCFKSAEILCKDIDLNDTAFIALSIHLKAKMWTGDKKLMNGLQSKGFYKIINTPQVFQYFLDKVSRKRK